jgi:DNA-nicking Smr family endonuclease
VSRGRRAPTPDELRLWAEVARTVAPLGGHRLPETDGEAVPAKAKAAPAIFPRPAPPPPTSAPLAKIDRRTFSRVARGSIEIDARLDLHGMTQQAAHGLLSRFLKQAQADGARLVLVITGKGRPGAETDHGDERGVLRRAVPAWLSAAEMRPYVVGFGEAAPPHGGTGALYVRIRRHAREGSASVRPR